MMGEIGNRLVRNISKNIKPAMAFQYEVICLCSIVLLFSWYHPSSADIINSDLILPGISRKLYSKPGDINIGSMMLLTQGYNDSGCSNIGYPGSWGIEYSEAVAFAVELVNNDSTLLSNMTLGFYILDDCTDRRVAMAQALTFLPREALTCSANACSNASISSVSALSPEFVQNPVPHYEVIGVLAPILSISAVSVSYLLSLAKIPIVGYTTTSDELSDKRLHPYFLRVVTPDKHQATAMLEFIASNKWTYISVIYSQGTYGERAYDVIKGAVSSFNICIAMAQRVLQDENMETVAKDLIGHSRARVVLVFADEVPAQNLFSAVEKLNATGEFVWVCCDSVAVASKEKLSKHLSSVIGAFMFTYYSKTVPEFYQYIRKQNASTSTNPWFRPSWENTTGCSFLGNTCNTSYDITTSVNFGFNTPPSLAMDAVLTFAHGVHDLIAKRCPTVRGSDVRTCLKRDLLLQFLRNVSFEGFTGRIRFDENQDLKGRYVIAQMGYDYFDVPTGTGQYVKSSEKGLVSKVVAYYDTFLKDLTYTNETITWDHLNVKERILPASLTPNPNIPESVCSRPCLVGEYKIQKELTCCWECRQCRDNEKLIKGNTACQVCEEFTWPDPNHKYTTCSLIPLSFPAISDILPVIQICLALLAITLTVMVIASYFHYRETRVMKAASRELSVLQLCGIFVGYITVICFQTEPTPGMCSALYFMFCLSFAWLYSPLLVKAIRIYRIFQSGSKNNQRPHFISPQSQVVMAFLIIVSQIVLCLVMYFTYQPTAKKTQPVATEKFVELSCDMTLPGLASFLVYNIVLVSLCSVFAFKTRKLPDNFNESKFISMCVYTTLVIWLAFIPTYFTASREYVKVLLLSLALLLNHTVALVFLFLPKIYATAYVASENLVTNRLQTGATGLSPHHNFNHSSNRVAPTTVTDHPRNGF